MFRRGFGIIWALVTLLIAIVVGGVAYQAGLSANVAANAAPGTYVVAPHLFWGLGFGLFGLVPLLFFLLLLFGLGRLFWWGSRGYYGGHPGQRMEDRLREWHERAHGNAPAERQGPES